MGTHTCSDILNWKLSVHTYRKRVNSKLTYDLIEWFDRCKDQTRITSLVYMVTIYLGLIHGKNIVKETKISKSDIFKHFKSMNYDFSVFCKQALINRSKRSWWNMTTNRRRTLIPLKMFQNIVFLLFSASTGEGLCWALFKGRDWWMNH